MKEVKYAAALKAALDLEEIDNADYTAKTDAWWTANKTRLNLARNTEKALNKAYKDQATL